MDKNMTSMLDFDIIFLSFKQLDKYFAILEFKLNLKNLLLHTPSILRQRFLYYKIRVKLYFLVTCFFIIISYFCGKPTKLL